MTGKHSGSCLCGGVTFEITGEFKNFFLCHCNRCRKGTGTVHGANLFAQPAELTWLSGEDQVRVYHLPGTRHAKSFCTTCGSALPGRDAASGLVVAPAGSLDSPVTIEPSAHIMMADKADWEEALKDAPQFDKYPE
ncbi:GFA family protein [Aestuariispira ectoiniformans]|uniref:GFA family protein n=1 Tax=Aestuariispira ectoiniformans TaxID=2775080 RepID=UPI00223B4969|nr:GFA family protein [Aestuariispira ectoiniformans]